MFRDRLLRLVPLALAALLLGCATGGQDPAPLPSPTATPGASPVRDGAWPLRTREHVDLWLHGFALISNDSTRVPYFQRGYGASMVAAKQRLNTLTQLDANRDRLSARFLAYPNLVSAHFVALYFGSWTDLVDGANLFMRAEGDPRSSNNAQAQQIIATFAAYFPTAPDREWLRLFLLALEDERAKFYGSHWQSQQRERAGVLAAADSLWRTRYRGKLQRYLNNTGLGSGDIIVSLPLDGEGRTITVGRSLNLVAVGFPAQVSEAVEVFYVFAHEVVASVTSRAIDDNTTPAEKRSGASQRYASNAAVRAGAMLIQKTAPELADGYARYYLRAANVSFTSGDAMAALATAFPLPDALRDAIARQLDVVLGGI